MEEQIIARDWQKRPIYSDEYDAKFIETPHGWVEVDGYELVKYMEQYEDIWSVNDIQTSGYEW